MAAKGARRSRAEQVPEQVLEWYPRQTLSPLTDGGVNSLEWVENLLDVLIKLKETDQFSHGGSEAQQRGT